MTDVRLTAWVRGRVQGVGFRWWTRARALELGLDGWARNTEDGRVEVVAQGPEESCARLLELLGSGNTPGKVDGVVERWSETKADVEGFVER
ncbi:MULTISPECIES: acylphosphatase [unclassified Streptosporangium]|uniref:acylphosphatase n=1 Tax=unclassified Streptosporangium TaxID=2632669 RepID=UPI002E294DF9|nr:MULTISPECIES: acylphosphatase [unclassified Streptosporangium]